MFGFSGLIFSLFLVTPSSIIAAVYLTVRLNMRR